ncbi:MAG: PIN/TRAM domain-containing protein [Planctomycetota bacterium]
MLLNLFRGIFVLLAFISGLLLGPKLLGSSPPTWIPSSSVYYGFFMAALACALVTLEIVFRRQYREALVAAFFGIGSGLVLTFGIFVLVSVVKTGQWLDKGVLEYMPLVATFVCYITTTIIFQTKDQFRFILPYIDLARQGLASGGIIVDTSVLIDGRIVELLQTNVMPKSLIIPRFVIDEVQNLADHSHPGKRMRGRRGLEILAKLKSVKGLIVSHDTAEFPETYTVDRQLVELTRRRDGILFTSDANLARVAQIENLSVISLPEVVTALRPPILQGLSIRVRIIKSGQGPGQGVGYLADGTMVVVEEASNMIGQDIDVEVLRAHQSSSGRMVFAKLAQPDANDPGSSRHKLPSITTVPELMDEAEATERAIEDAPAAGGGPIAAGGSAGPGGAMGSSGATGATGANTTVPPVSGTTGAPGTATPGVRESSGSARNSSAGARSGPR